VQLRGEGEEHQQQQQGLQDKVDELEGTIRRLKQQIVIASSGGGGNQGNDEEALKKVIEESGVIREIFKWFSWEPV